MVLRLIEKGGGAHFLILFLRPTRSATTIRLAVMSRNSVPATMEDTIMGRSHVLPLLLISLVLLQLVLTLLLISLVISDIMSPTPAHKHNHVVP